jgi:predicted ABC-type ATPase
LSSKLSGQEPDQGSANFVAVCTVIGGPNGSGKSTVFELLKPDGEFVNADIIARRIDPNAPQSVDLLAARATLERLQELLIEASNFVFETTLSGHQSLALMERARSSGYQVGLVFVALADVDLNVKRVAERVSKGGHDIPNAIIRRRYLKSFSNLAKAIKISHGCLIYDNSRTSVELLVRMRGMTVEVNNLDQSYAHHALIANAIAGALGVGVEAVYQLLKNT